MKRFVLTAIPLGFPADHAIKSGFEHLTDALEMCTALHGDVNYGWTNVECLDSSTGRLAYANGAPVQ